MAKKKKKVLGIGLDSSDEQKRITRSENFTAVGGSKETHEKMQEVIIRVEEGLKGDHKNMSDCSWREIRDRIYEAHEKTGN